MPTCGACRLGIFRARDTRRVSACANAACCRAAPGPHGHTAPRGAGQRRAAQARPPPASAVSAAGAGVRAHHRGRRWNSASEQRGGGVRPHVAGRTRNCCQDRRTISVRRADQTRVVGVAARTSCHCSRRWGCRRHAGGQCAAALTDATQVTRSTAAGRAHGRSTRELAAVATCQANGAGDRGTVGVHGAELPSVVRTRGVGRRRHGRDRGLASGIAATTTHAADLTGAGATPRRAGRSGADQHPATATARCDTRVSAARRAVCRGVAHLLTPIRAQTGCGSDTGSDTAAAAAVTTAANLTCRAAGGRARRGTAGARAVVAQVAEVARATLGIRQTQLRVAHRASRRAGRAGSVVTPAHGAGGRRVRSATADFAASAAHRARTRGHRHGAGGTTRRVRRAAERVGPCAHAGARSAYRATGGTRLLTEGTRGAARHAATGHRIDGGAGGGGHVARAACGTGEGDVACAILGVRAAGACRRTSAAHRRWARATAGRRIGVSAGVRGSRCSVAATRAAGSCQEGDDQRRDSNIRPETQKVHLNFSLLWAGCFRSRQIITERSLALSGFGTHLVLFLRERQGPGR